MADTVLDAPTLRALLRRRDLGLTLRGDEAALAPDALDIPLRWVHSSDLIDPTPFLSEGLLLLTTGTQFASGSESDTDGAYRAYVTRLRGRGVAGLGFGTEVVRAGIPPLLIDACADARLPIFEVPYRTPFIAVARANAEAIAAESYARRSWSLAAQRAISLAALRPDGLGAGLAELARQLDTWVGLYDTAGTLARRHPAGALDAATQAHLDREAAAVLRRGARAASAIRVDGRAFTLQTLGRGGHLRGVLAIASEGMDQEARGVVTSVIAMVGLALEQTHDLARGRGLLRAGLVQSLLSDDPSIARRVARDAWGGLPVAPIVVALAETSSRNADTVSAFLELRAEQPGGDTRRAEDPAPRVFFGRADDGLLICTEAAEPSLIDDLARAFDLRVGVSEPARYDEFSRAYAQARSALLEGSAGVTHFSDVARKGLLALADAGLARIFAQAALAPLLAHDREHRTELVETVRVWLENDAKGDAAARALGIHRHTVRARIGQVERLIDRDLSGFAARAELWAALQLSS
ncbi:MAG TPA: PucR family transcriptional regulator [Microbacterium sp.]|uniref:PucR family transcriptional regulator n=1 Tax=Microbacterium sp. TaxID=51671 RepID=UPI002CCE7375|nr:PucR family transcriptional regulator [Microbacterium sp.]HWI31878.1 PucR family transcriptional regulator [Microbacterium sp.]